MRGASKLIDKIKKEGLETAEKKGKELHGEAQIQAAGIIKDAQKQGGYEACLNLKEEFENGENLIIKKIYASPVLQLINQKVIYAR